MRLIDADALKEKLKEHYDLFVSAYQNVHEMSLADKLRVDEMINSLAEVTNAPTICDIDKILDEIKYYRDSYDLDNYHDEADALTLALKIIDMHTAGSRITNNE